MGWLASIRPLKRLGKSSVEIVNELFQSIFQFRQRGKVSSLDSAAVDDSENDFDLVEPRRVLGKVNQANPVALVGQKFDASCHRLKNSVFPFS